MARAAFSLSRFILRISLVRENSCAARSAMSSDVTFPERKRKVGAYAVGWYSNAVAGKEAAKTMLALDRMDGVDLFPMASDEILVGMLDHVDMLVIPDGNAKFYANKVKPEVRTLIAAFQNRGGRIVGWGAGARACTGLAEDLGSAEATLAVVSAQADFGKISAGEASGK